MNSEKNNLRVLGMYITTSAHKLCTQLANKLSFSVEVKKLPKDNFRNFFKEAFKYDVIIAVMATGIVVRGLAPFIKSKQTDPAVIVIDEKGKFVISLLSGHIGGANMLAREIANLINATPVITTSSDINNLPAVDVYAKEMNYTISDFKICKDVAMALIKGKKIPVYVETGEPKHFFRQPCFQLLDKKSFLKIDGLKIAVSEKLICSNDTLYLIPKRLVLGMGFHRGLDFEAMMAFVKSQFKIRKLFLDAVKIIATIDKRNNEKGFFTLCDTIKATPIFFSENELAAVSAVTQSEVVKKYHFSGNVSEAAALLASNHGKIIVSKIKGGNITLCIAKEKYL